MAGLDIGELQQDLMRLGYAIPAPERHEQEFGVVTARSVAAFQTAQGLPDTAVVDELTALALTRAVNEADERTMMVLPPTRAAAVGAAQPSRTPPEAGPPSEESPDLTRLAALAGRFLELGAATAEPEGYEVAGKVYFDHGAPAAGARIRVYDKGFGEERRLLGEQTVASDGSYRLAYDPADRPANLDLRLVTNDGREITLADTRFQAGRREQLNLVAPGGKLAPEWDRLQADLRPHLGEADLADARESDERADVTLLRQATGWDARVVALAAQASALAPEIGLIPQALYAALRAGLPADKRQLAEVRPELMEQTLRRSAEAGVAALSEEDIARAVTAFQGFTRLTRRANVAPGALSSHGDMLAMAGLSERQQDSFDDLLADHAGDPRVLWERAAERDLPVPRLRVAGKLGYLTANNAKLASALLPDIEQPEALGAALAAQRLYDAGAWEEKLAAVAGREDVAAVIPPAYKDIKDYSRDLARKVRLSYPTQVVTQMVKQGELPLGEDVGTFLTRAAEKGFTLGRTPMSRFLRDNHSAVFDGMPERQIAAATEQAGTLQRMYQISPSDAALKVLLDNGFSTAQQVSAMSYEKFVDRYGPQFESIDVARLVWRKAQQVSVVVHTFFGAAKQAETAPPVFAVTPPAQAQQEAKDNFLKQYPTIESLFGSQDYCECDHCRSVLSPAAYLVDLLKFLDPDALEWAGDLTDWKAKHGGAPYPFPDMATWNDYQSQVDDPMSELTPFQVLSARRPDIPELQLTCENTNTVLPYIDLTNEILEYWIAHGKLEPGAVHDTGDELTADLLAEPQYLIPSVYETLSSARYPLKLPFDLWQATVREFLNHFDAPLWRLLQAVAGADEDVVLLERLGLPPADLDILTAADPLAAWHELYGYPDAGAAMADLPNAKKLARRLGVTYKELVALVKSGFVNPKLETLAALRRMGIEVEDVMRYKEQPGYAAFTAQEKTEFAAQVAEAGGTAWLEQAWAAGEFGQVLVLADPQAGCGFDTTTLRFADGTPATAEAFVRLNFLTRLWRRLRWSIEETDRALCVFRPDGPLGTTMRHALVGMAKAEALTGYFGSGAAARRKVLFLYSDLDDRRYRELFLTRSVLPTDPVFDSPDGNYLSAGNLKLADHLGAVKAALKLTTEEVEGLVDLPAAPLDIPTLSLLHRWSLLAKALRLKVKDLIALRQLTGLDPFTAAFIELAQDLKPLSAADLDYVVRHEFDPVGPYRSAARPPFDLLRTLTAEIDRITKEHADRALTDSELRSELALALPAEVVDATMAALAGTATQASVGALLSKHLVELGFLTQTQLDDVFAPVPGGAGPAAAQAHADAKRKLLADAFLPHLRAKLTRAAIIEQLGPASEVVLDAALYDTFAAAAQRGFDKSGHDLDGWIQVPVTGIYTFSHEVSLDHLADPVAAGAEVELKAGTLYRLTLKSAQPVELTIAGGGQPAGPLADVQPHTVVQALWDAHQHVSKLLLLAEKLELTDGELAFLLPELKARTIDAVLDAVAHAKLREALGADPADLVELMGRAKRTFPAAADPAVAKAEVLHDLCERFGAITRRTPELVESVATPAESVVDGDRLVVIAPGFSTTAGLKRMWEILELAKRLGAGVDALRLWAVPSPGFEIARDLRDTVKARYEVEQWRRVAQPINDRLRKARRDALVAYVMHHHPAGFAAPEQLFEYFLIDPGMEPVVHTSRLRLAISAVQTFIQRCLLNLEIQVHPSALNAPHWEWMKRYRVWEANRKIFLWPENWLHPEFRDDKSHLFVAMESALLEGDISDDLVERALYEYLRGLEEIARLDVRSIYLQERPDPADNVVHVVARTFAAPHKYFYRRYSHRMWTPWLPVTPEIEGDHLAAVVWRERVHLFWVTVIDKHDRRSEQRSPADMLSEPVSTAEVPRVAQVHLHWTELYQGQWTDPGQTDLSNPLEVVVPNNYDARWERMHITRDTANGADALMIHLNGEINTAFRLASKLAPPTHEGSEAHPILPYPVLGLLGEWIGYAPLAVTYVEETKQKGLSTPIERTETRAILGKEKGYRLRWPANRTERLPAELANLVSPFFYQHGEHSFYIEPELTEKTLVEWDNWVVTVPPAVDWDPERLPPLKPLIPFQPKPDPIGPIAKFAISTPQDWLTESATVIHFGDRAFTNEGKVQL